MTAADTGPNSGAGETHRSSGNVVFRAVIWLTATGTGALGRLRPLPGAVESPVATTGA